MKNIPLSVLVITACVAALTSAVTASLMVTSSGGQEPVEGPRLAVTATVPVEVRDELAALREENRQLVERIVALERRPQPIQTAPFPTEEDAATREELAALAKKVARWMPKASQGGSPESLDDPEAIEPTPAFTATVERTLRSIRRREKADGWRRGTRDSLKKLDNRLDRMRSDLNLSDYQVDELRTAFTGAHERNLELIRLWEEGETSDEHLGEIKRTNREQHEQALASILTAEQHHRHRAAREQDGKR